MLVWNSNVRATRSVGNRITTLASLKVLVFNKSVDIILIICIYIYSVCVYVCNLRDCLHLRLRRDTRKMIVNYGKVRVPRTRVYGTVVPLAKTNNLGKRRAPVVYGPKERTRGRKGGKGWIEEGRESTVREVGDWKKKTAAAHEKPRGGNTRRSEFQIISYLEHNAPIHRLVHTLCPMTRNRVLRDVDLHNSLDHR